MNKENTKFLSTFKTKNPDLAKDIEAMAKEERGIKTNYFKVTRLVIGAKPGNAKVKEE